MAKANSSSKFICLKCIGDKPLQVLVEENSAQICCSYCHHESTGISMEEFAKIVDEYLRNYIGIGESHPTYPDDSDSATYEQEGESLEWVLQEELGIDYDPAKDLVAILVKNDPAYPPDGEDPFYQDDQNYVRANVSSREHHHNWDEFTIRVKHQRRFFDIEVKDKLASLLGKPGSPEALALPTLVIEPGGIDLMYRARLISSRHEAIRILREPQKELKSPQSKDAKAGRMNPAGISVFYGALSENTAIAEVRPSVGSSVVVGAFKILKKMRLLNLPQIDLCYTGSIFDPDYENRVSRRDFFQKFHNLITKPILPTEEFIEYVPTQAVAEYVAHVLNFDGIIYASAQVSSSWSEDEEPVFRTHAKELSQEELQKCNVVLFGEWHDLVASESIVLQGDIVKAVKVSSVQYQYVRDFEIEYSSHED